MVGDADPLQAIADGLAVFDPDELIIATHPEGDSNWLEHDLVERAEAAFALPVTHVVVPATGRDLPLAAVA
jgi:GABA permease